MIVDAGGGTVDLSSYTFTSTAPLTASEIAPPGCEYRINTLFFGLLNVFKGVLEGSTIVTRRVEQFLKGPFHVYPRYPFVDEVSPLQNASRAQSTEKRGRSK